MSITSPSILADALAAEARKAQLTGMRLEMVIATLNALAEQMQMALPYVQAERAAGDATP